MYRWNMLGVYVPAGECPDHGNTNNLELESEFIVEVRVITMVKVRVSVFGWAVCAGVLQRRLASSILTWKPLSP